MLWMPQDHLWACPVLLVSAPSAPAEAGCLLSEEDCLLEILLPHLILPERYLLLHLLPPEVYLRSPLPLPPQGVPVEHNGCCQVVHARFRRRPSLQCGWQYNDNRRRHRRFALTEANPRVFKIADGLMLKFFIGNPLACLDEDELFLGNVIVHITSLPF